MVEEEGFTIDMEAYEKSRKIALESSQGKGGAVVDDCKLDVHAISELKSKNIPPTDDSPKYNYKATTEAKDGAYEFEKCEAKVVAIRFENQFVQEAKEGQKCCLILDKTCFYAEQSGQIYDQGFITANGTYGSESFSKLIVDKVLIQSGYILHIGKITAGVFSCGNQVALNYDTKRRRLIMNNHSGTHILNHALREVLGPDSQQKGSLVAPDRLRFDFSCKAAMTIDQVRKTEQIVQDIIKRNGIVYTKLCKLEDARKICGLRAMFDETYPDPVRVVSVGEPVEKLENNPQSKASLLTSVEFCGGTHVHRSGHIEEFLITSEEAISEGIRRIIAITGPDALNALNRTDALKVQIEELVKLKEESYDVKVLLKIWIELNDKVSRSLISTCSKDELQKELNELKKKVDTKPPFKFGDRVMVTSKKTWGRIAYIGVTSFQPGKWVGVILDEPKGRNNGTIGEVEYFKCSKNYGLFVRENVLSKREVEGMGKCFSKLLSFSDDGKKPDSPDIDTENPLQDISPLAAEYVEAAKFETNRELNLFFDSIEKEGSNNELIEHDLRVALRMTTLEKNKYKKQFQLMVDKNRKMVSAKRHELMLSIRSRIEFLEEMFNSNFRITGTKKTRVDTWYDIFDKGSETDRQLNWLKQQVIDSGMQYDEFAKAIGIIYKNSSEKAAHGISMPDSIVTAKIDDLLKSLQLTPDAAVKKTMGILIKPCLFQDEKPKEEKKVDSMSDLDISFGID